MDLERRHSLDLVGISVAVAAWMLLASGCGQSPPRHSAASVTSPRARVTHSAAEAVGAASISADGAPSLPTPVTTTQLKDLLAPASVAIYPLAATTGCSTHMPPVFVAQLYALALQGTVLPNSAFDPLQPGMTFKIGVFPADTAYTFNATTDVLHRPGSGAPELTLRVPAQVGTVLAAADQAGCTSAVA